MKGLDINIERISLAVLALLMAVVFPMVLNGFYLNLVAKYASYAFVAIGIVLIWGFSGILSLGQGVFFGLGGYAMAMYLKLAAAPGALPDFMTWSGVSSLPGWWVPFHSLGFAVAAGLLVPAVLAYVFSYLVFKKRVSGVYFAIVTLALALTFPVHAAASSLRIASRLTSPINPLGMTVTTTMNSAPSSSSQPSG